MTAHAPEKSISCEGRDTTHDRRQRDGLRHVGELPRANCHASFQATVENGGFGRFYHVRELAPVGEVQLGIGENRDTLYSLGVFDLTEPVTITKPETGGRYQSMLVQNEDQYLKLSTTRPGKYTITRAQAGTRYIGVNLRTFVDPNDPVDVRQVQELQNEIVVEQASAGSFEIPNWDRQSYRSVDAAFRTLYYTMDDWSNAFGDVDQVDPVKFYVASASGWTGVPEPSEALILQGAPSRNDGKTPHTLTSETFRSTGSGQSPSTTATWPSSRTPMTPIS